jgi:hypothetical protein
MWHFYAEVSKAFQCLTDPEKRAFYDRTGHEDPNAAAAASRGTGMHAQGVYRDLDPEELFNMMFGGGGLRGFGMGPMHFGGFSAGPGGFRQGPRQPQHEQDGQGFNFGGLPPPLAALARSFAHMGPVQKLMLFSMALRMLPIIFSLISWLGWGLLLGTPVWLVCREVVEFDRRRIYQPFHGVPPVCDAVKRVHPFATTFLSLSQPFTAMVGSLWRGFLEWAKMFAGG